MIQRRNRFFSKPLVFPSSRAFEGRRRFDKQYELVLGEVTRMIASSSVYVIQFLVLCCMATVADASAAYSSTFARAKTSSTTAADSPRTVERFVVHRNFDRLFVSGLNNVDVTPASDGSSLALRYSASTTIGSIAHCGRRLTSLKGGAGAAVVSLTAGAQFHFWQVGGSFILDVIAPTKGKGVKHETSVVSTQTAPQSKSSLTANAGKIGTSSIGKAALGVLPYPTASEQVESQGQSADVSLPTPSNLSMPVHSETPLLPSLSSVSLLSESNLPGPAVLFPISGKAGAAAFFRGGEAHIVFDRSQAIDLSPLKGDAVFGGVTQTILANGTEIRFPASSTANLHLVQYRGNWAVSLSALIPFAAPTPLTGQIRAGVLVFDMKSPGQTIVLQDEVTGGRLLVGTEREGGQRVASQHTVPELAVLATWRGLVVAPASDRLQLRAIPAGYEVSTTEGPAVSTSWPKQTIGSWPEGRSMTRMFDFSDLPPDGQNRQLKQALQDVARLPKTARYAARVRVAQAMLAEGLDVEAAAVVQTAIADDPSHRDDPIAAGLSTVATWLSAASGGNALPTLPVDTARFGGSDEATFWRALLKPDQHDVARQAATLAATWPLLLGYPQNLRRSILRPTAALLAAGGQDKAWAAFLAAFPGPSLDLSRASYLQSHGKIAESLALLDKVAQRSDRLARVEALGLAVEGRLKSGQLSAAQAAERFERQLYAWRDDSRELNMRLRLAQLQAKAGSWRAALEGLDEAEALFPADQDDIRNAKVTTIAALLKSDQADKLTALDLVNLAAQAARLPSDVGQGRFTPMLAEKLLALDLPEQAEPILSNLFSNATDPQSKAEIGLTLAELQAGRGEEPAALAVLDKSSDSGLTPAIAADRTLLRARLLAALGKPTAALAALLGQPGRKARELEAAIMEGQHDWAGGANSLDGIVKAPEFAALPDVSQQKIIIHLARDRSEALDIAGLRQLRSAFAAKFKAGPDAALFTVLTADPIQNIADLPRSANEVAAMHALPASLSQPAP